MATSNPCFGVSPQRVSSGRRAPGSGQRRPSPRPHLRRTPPVQSGLDSAQCRWAEGAGSVFSSEDGCMKGQQLHLLPLLLFFLSRCDRPQGPDGHTATWFWTRGSKSPLCAVRGGSCLLVEERNDDSLTFRIQSLHGSQTARGPVKPTGPVRSWEGPVHMPRSSGSETVRVGLGLRQEGSWSPHSVSFLSRRDSNAVKPHVIAVTM